MINIFMISDFIYESKNRGFLYQATDLERVDYLLSKKKIVAYIGYDPTARSLHVGSLTTIMWLRRLEHCGHQPIILLGGATACIGDPSGKDTQRPLLDQKTINENIKSIKKIFSCYLKEPVIVNNIDWLTGLNYIEFLRDYGKHFSINKMLTFDMVKSRLDREEPLNFIEFNYMIFQAYDFMVLNKQYDCILQMGGSDQWGNIVNGVELVRRVHNRETFGLTCPLIKNSSGQKMGKTAQGAVWLDSELLSPFDFWQFWRNTHDEDVIKYLRLFTDLSLDEITKLEQLQGQELNAAKIILADEATKLTHGESSLEKIHQAADNIFYNQGIVTVSVPLVEVDYNVYRLDDLLVKVGLCQSKREAKQKLMEGAVKIDNQVIKETEEFKLIDEHLISVGKKRYKRVKVRQ